MTDDERILDLNNEIHYLLIRLLNYENDYLPDLRNYEDADIYDLEELRDQIVEAYNMMSNIYYKYNEEEE